MPTLTEVFTGFANNIRALIGTDNTMTPAEMTEQLADANDEIDVQAELIERIYNSLDGKATPEGSGNTDISDSIIKRTITEYSSATIQNIGRYAFCECRKLFSADFYAASFIDDYAFSDCASLQMLILRNTKKVCDFGDFVFTNSGIDVNKGYIYVPSALVTEYKNKILNGLSDNIRALENYTVDGTTTGAFDIQKILITFYIDDISYNAFDGYTWSDWIDSTYNTDGFIDQNDGFVWDKNADSMVLKNGIEVDNASYIVAGEHYTTGSGSGIT